VEYAGIDWASRRAAWCALDPAGELLGEGVMAADLDGLTGLVARRGLEVSAAVEMMSGAVWVADTLRGALPHGTSSRHRRARDDHRTSTPCKRTSLAFGSGGTDARAATVAQWRLGDRRRLRCDVRAR
jgi:hypothetical protein